MHTLIGIVGYCGFVRDYPLGPELMARLQAQRWPRGVEIREMNWGPVAIVQDLQAGAARPARVVLVGAPDRGLPHGSVTRRRWAGGALPAQAVQRRMFEAVTGVIGVDNLLVIGAHFGVWPEATFTAELQWPESGLGDLVQDELAAAAQGVARVVGERPISAANAALVELIVDAVRALALDSVPAGVQALTVEQLNPVATVSHHRFVDDAGRPAGP